LNEFLANPKTLYDDEWIELYNSGSASADLAGWKLDDGEGGGSPHTLSAGSIVAPGGYLVVDLSTALLNNDGDILRLIRPDGVAVDSTSFTGSAPDASRSRSSDGAWYDGGEPTPGEPNLPPSVQPAPTEGLSASNTLVSADSAAPTSKTWQVSLNEVLPAPKEAFDAEWIEIANDGDAAADLTGWMIDDAADGASFTLPPASVVAPHGLLMVRLPRAIFNNDGDDVRLLRPDRTEADEFNYDSSTADLSLCRLAGVWAEDCSPTPGKPNAVDVTTPAPEPNDLVASAADELTDHSVEEAGASVEHTLSAMAAPRQPIRLRGANAGGPVYALAMPGSVYAGIWSATATPSPSPIPAPPRQLASPQPQIAPPTPATAPLLPIAGGLAIATGVGVAGHEYLRLRGSLEVHEAVAEDELAAE
jgi:hypothetical protein